jgi:hypothetical protein
MYKEASKKGENCGWQKSDRYLIGAGHIIDTQILIPICLISSER